MRKILLAFLLLPASPARAQFTDSLKIFVGITATLATNKYQPLWAIANRYGTIADRQADASTYVLIRNKHVVGRSSQAETNAPAPGFFVGYGAAVYNNDRFQRTFFKEGYALVGYRNWLIRAGRYEAVTGETDPLLSSGSLGISSNALPIPKVELAVADYTAVPFTHGWLQFKGKFAHGWFGNAPEIKGAYLHEKSLYLRAGRKQFSVYGGLTHFAQWGGAFSSGQAPGRLKDYLRIIAGASGNAADPVYRQGPVDIANAVGNHIIVPDFGLIYRKNDASLKLYTQTIFDKGIGDSSNTNKRDRLNGLKILSRDRLVGVSWESRKSSLLRKIVVEGLYTKHQGGPIIYNGRDNYYNNGTYRMGWQYKDRIIGTPLFINSANARNYNFNLNPDAIGGWGVVSNRVVGLHLGMAGNISENLDYRVLATHVQHHGNYDNDAYFTPAKKQTHVLCELPYRFNSIALTAAVATDFGDLSTNTAGMLRVEWKVW